MSALSYIALFGIVAFLAFLAYLAYLIKTAPEGYEDENGFHYGKQKDEHLLP